MRALARAQEATYGAWSLRGADAAYRDRYFDRVRDRFVLRADVRREVRFQIHNLAAADYPGDFDLILCRNVFIYFDAASVRAVGRRLARALAPGGWLMLGASDPMLEGVAGLQAVTFGSGVVYHRAPAEPAQVIPPPEEIEPVSDRKSEDVSIESPAAIETATSRNDDEVHAAIEQLRGVADAGSTNEALELAAALIDRFPLAAELHLLHAMLLVDLDRTEMAEGALRRALFLDASSAIAHFRLALVLRRNGNNAAAARSFQNAIAAAERTSGRAARAQISSDEIRAAARMALQAMAAEGHA
jgi:chemotaxis protein methyltransferase CheR